MTGRNSSQSSKATGNRKHTQKAKTKRPAVDDSSGDEFSPPAASSVSETNPRPEERGRAAGEPAAEDQAGTLQSQSQSQSQPQLQPPTTIPPAFSSRSQSALRSDSSQLEKGAKDVNYFFDRERGNPSICQDCK